MPRVVMKVRRSAYLVADLAAEHGLWLAESVADIGVAVSVATFFYRWFEAIPDGHQIALGEGSNL
jgi:hypothetical protein